jgi:stearoyl-CoA desaturase (delta-9 desaturase)
MRWLALTPFFAVHLMCFATLYVGISTAAVLTAAACYVVRMLFITGFYHRYFSHRAYRTSRAFQFLMALAGCTAGQRGPIWWSGQHRIHHAHSDQAGDPHSPRRHGFWTSHVLWFLTRDGAATPWPVVKDWARYPELRWLERYNWLPPTLLACALYQLGEVAARLRPEWRTDGPQLLVWGFFVSTTLLYHATYTINSLAHRFGRQRYSTGDDSRNNGLLAIVTLGEGWHNNHHYFPAAARQGFFWWEIDPTYYFLVALSMTGLIRDLRAVPGHILDASSRQAGSARP